MKESKSEGMGTYVIASLHNVIASLQLAISSLTICCCKFRMLLQVC